MCYASGRAKAGRRPVFSGNYARLASRQIVFSSLAFTVVFIYLAQTSYAQGLPSRPQLTVSGTASPNPVTAGGILTYTITVQNVGDTDAMNVVLRDSLQQPDSFIDCVTDTGTCSAEGGTIKGSLGALVAGASATVVSRVIAPIGTLTADIHNPVTVSAESVDEVTATYSADVAVTVQGVPMVTQGGGPPGASIRALAVDPRNSSTLYAGTDFGLFKSTDSGANWSVSQNQGARAIVIDPSNSSIVYAVTSFQILKSTDAGATWTRSDTGISIANAMSLAINPANPSILYAGTNFVSNGCDTQYIGAVFKSTDAGTSWTRASAGLPNHSVRSLAVDPTNPLVVYAGTSGLINHCGNTSGGGLFKSKDGGANWTTSDVGLDGTGVIALLIDPANPSTLYSVTNGFIDTATGFATGFVIGGGSSSGPHVFKSTDQGATWTPLDLRAGTSSGPFFQVYMLTIDPRQSSVLYAGTNAGILKSTNAGANWSLINSRIRSVQAFAIDTSNTSILYAGTASGVFKSVNGGALWNASSTGFANTTVSALAIDPVDPSTMFASTFAINSDSGLFKTTNAGADWTLSSLPLSFFSGNITFDPFDHSTVYVAGGALFKTINGGGDWIRVRELPDPNVTKLVIDPSNSSVLYVATSRSGLFKSIDRGASWFAINSGLPVQSISGRLIVSFIYCMTIDARNPSILYVGTHDGVFKTTDGGESWTLANTGLPTQPVGIGLGTAVPAFAPDVLTLTVDPSDSSIVYAGIKYVGVFKSTDGGATWTESDLGLPRYERFGGTTVSVLLIDAANPLNIYAGSDKGVFKTTDGGKIWTSSGPIYQVNALAMNPSDHSILYAGTTGYGVFKSVDAATTWQPTGAR